MKKIFSRILAVGLLSAGIIGVSSCDYLDQKPENLKTTDMIWETRVEAEAYLYILLSAKTQKGINIPPEAL